MTPTAEGYYWYRSTDPDDPASSGDWTVLSVDGKGWVSVADLSLPLDEFKGEWRGPILPPEDE